MLGELESKILKLIWRSLLSCWDFILRVNVQTSYTVCKGFYQVHVLRAVSD